MMRRSTPAPVAAAAPAKPAPPKTLRRLTATLGKLPQRSGSVHTGAEAGAHLESRHRGVEFIEWSRENASQAGRQSAAFSMFALSVEFRP
jgi:hypothetical protein